VGALTTPPTPPSQDTRPESWRLSGRTSRALGQPNTWSPNDPPRARPLHPGRDLLIWSDRNPFAGATFRGCVKRVSSKRGHAPTIAPTSLPSCPLASRTARIRRRVPRKHEKGELSLRQRPATTHGPGLDPTSLHPGRRTCTWREWPPLSYGPVPLVGCGQVGALITPGSAFSKSRVSRSSSCCVSRPR
jgi:hypothetical protein